MTQYTDFNGSLFLYMSYNVQSENITRKKMKYKENAKHVAIINMCKV